MESQIPVQQPERATLVTQLNPEPLIERLQHRLMGEKWDSENEKWVQKGTPMINKEGAEALCSNLRTVMNVNTILTNLTEREIKNQVKAFGKSINQATVVNKSKWGISDNSVRALVCFSCALTLEHALMRSLTTHADKVITDKELLKNVTQERQLVRQLETEKKKKGLFSFLGGSKDGDR